MDAATDRGGTWREILVEELWQHRDLLHQLTLRDIRIRYKQAAMGFAWAIFMPALVVLAGSMVRFAMGYISGSDVSRAQIATIAVKALPWSFFVGAIGFATNTLIANMTLVTKVYFPREVLPISATLAQTFDSTIGGVALLFVLPVLGVHYSLTGLWAIPLLVLLFCFTAGASLFLAAANLFFRDVKYIVQVLLMFGIFFTPVFFEPSMLGPLGSKLVMLNPLAPMIEGIRLAVVNGHDLLRPLLEIDSHGRQVVAWSPLYLVYAAGWGVGALAVSLRVFHRLERIFAEYV